MGDVSSGLPERVLTRQSLPDCTATVRYWAHEHHVSTWPPYTTLFYYRDISYFIAAHPSTLWQNNSIHIGWILLPQFPPKKSFPICPGSYAIVDPADQQSVLTFTQGLVLWAEGGLLLLPASRLGSKGSERVGLESQKIQHSWIHQWSLDITF